MATKGTTEKNPISGTERGHYYEAFKQGRGHAAEVVVKVWATDKKEGEPKEEWCMPAILGFGGAVSQAILQTK